MRTGSIHEEHIVMLFPGALGDFLLALPTLRLLRRRHTRATVVVSEQVRPLAELTRVADVVASLDAADAAYLFGGSTRPSWLMGRPVVVSWLGARDRDLTTRLRHDARVVHTCRIERGSGAAHAALAYARAAGLRATWGLLASQARVAPPRSPVADALLTDRAPMLAVHAGAGASGKRWAKAGFTDVAHWWAGRGGAVVELVGPAESDGVLDTPVVRARGLALGDLAALLSRATLYLGNDSGVSHLAGAVGVSGVVLFGSTAARRWRPIDRRLLALQADGSPTGIPLSALPSVRVVAALRRRLGAVLPLTTKRAEISVPG